MINCYTCKWYSNGTSFEGFAPRCACKPAMHEAFMEESVEVPMVRAGRNKNDDLALTAMPCEVDGNCLECYEKNPKTFKACVVANAGAHENNKLVFEPATKEDRRRILEKFSRETCFFCHGTGWIQDSATGSELECHNCKDGTVTCSFYEKDYTPQLADIVEASYCGDILKPGSEYEYPVESLELDLHIDHMALMSGAV